MVKVTSLCRSISHTFFNKQSGGKIRGGIPPVYVLKRNKEKVRQSNILALKKPEFLKKTRREWGIIRVDEGTVEVI